MPVFAGMMPSRPMRRARREVVDTRELAAIVERAQVLHVGSSDAEGLFVVPMSFGFEVEGEGPSARWTFWLHSAEAGRKAEAWLASPEVALGLDVPAGVIEGDYACAYSYAYESVMASGRIARVLDAAEKVRGLARIMEHMAPGAPATFSDEAVERVAVWRVDVEHLTGKRREGMSVASQEMPVSGRMRPDATKKAKADAFGSKKGSAEKSSEKASGGKMSSGKSKGGKLKDAKTSKKERRRRIEQALVGERCPGCGRHCKLADPACGKGLKLRNRRLEKLGVSLA